MSAKVEVWLAEKDFIKFINNQPVEAKTLYCSADKRDTKVIISLDEYSISQVFPKESFSTKPHYLIKKI